MPAFDPATGQFRLDANGNVIPTLLLQPANYSVLGKMAGLSGGKFYRATNRRDLQTIYNQIDQLEKSEGETPAVCHLRAAVCLAAGGRARLAGR